MPPGFAATPSYNIALHWRFLRFRSGEGARYINPT